MRNVGRREHGQVLVIFAGALIVLLAIGAVVVDLGMSWMLRRQEQNAVDPGALAAAKFVTNDTTFGATPEMIAAACHYARANGFFPTASTDATDLSAPTSGTGCVPTNDPEGASLTVHYPPVGPSAGAFAGRFGFVQVGLTRAHPDFFSRIFGVATSSVSASAVAANTSGDSNSYSLIALDPNADQNSGQLGGGGNATGNVIIAPATNPATGQPYQGGYVQVNSTYGGILGQPTLATCPSNGTGAFRVSGNSSIQAPAIFVTGMCGDSGTVTTNAGPGMVTEGALQVGDPLAELQPPAIDTSQPGQPCTTGGSPTTAANPTGCKFNTNGATYQLQPGVYYGGWSISGKNVTLQLASGIYIMAGGGISLGSTGSITSVSGSAGPAPVTIFSTDDPTYHPQCVAGSGAPGGACQGALSLTASSMLDLAGMDSGPYKGILLWQDGNVSQDGNASCTMATAKCQIALGGQTSLWISGTIYAPKTQVTLTGGSSTSGCSSTGTPNCASIQIISWNWQITGGSTLYMPYDPNQLYHLEQRGLVH